MRLSEELALFGYDGDPDDFNDKLQEVFAVLFPTWSIEELERRPTHGVSYVHAVRRAVQCPHMEEEFIMRRLQNVRKSGRERRGFGEAN